MFHDLRRHIRHTIQDLTDRINAGSGKSSATPPSDGSAPSSAPSSSPAAGAGLSWRWRVGLWSAVGLFLFSLVYYPVGMLMVHVVDDDPTFDVPAAEILPNQSRAVAMTAALINREVNVHPWVANDPFFMPGAMLERMPSFQQGIISALGRFAFELTDQIGRVRGSSKADANLQQAAGLLQYSGTVWFFDSKVSLMPTASSESQYRRARQALLDYNMRLASREAVFDPRTDNLLATVDRFASDLGSSSAQLDRLIRDGGFWSSEATRFYYDSKGRSYAYYQLMKALGDDYQSVIKDRQLQGVWDQAVASLAEAARLKPILVLNATPGTSWFPNDLAAQGFYILRARTQLREITSVLQK